MATKTATPDELRAGDEVVARTDLRGVPGGTAGTVSIVTGLSWVRYWVRFDNGVQMGSINRSKLATPDEWRRIQSGELDTEESAADDAGEGGDAAAGGGAGGGKTTPSGTLVPQLLLDRSKAAHERLGR